MEHSFLDEVRQISDSARNKTKILTFRKSLIERKVAEDTFSGKKCKLAKEEVGLVCSCPGIKVNIFNYATDNYMLNVIGHIKELAGEGSTHVTYDYAPSRITDTLSAHGFKVDHRGEETIISWGKE